MTERGPGRGGKNPERPPSGERAEQPPRPLLFIPVKNIAERERELHDAIDYKESDRVLALLNQPDLLESALIKKGPQGRYLWLIDQALAVMTDAAGLPRLDKNPSPSELKRLIQDGGVDPFAIAQWCNGTYHRMQRVASGSVEQLPQIQVARRLIALPIDPMVQANLYNCIASHYAKSGDKKTAREVNKQGLEVLHRDAQRANDPNMQWQEFKLQHGTIIDRSAEKVFPDMPGQLIQLAEQREDLGDAAHVGRTYLDVAQLYLRLGKKEEAVFYLQRAIAELEEQGYISKLVEATRLLADIHTQAMGHTPYVRRTVVHGMGKGSRLERLYPTEIEALRTESEIALKLPALCLLQLGQRDAYVIERIQDHPEDPVQYALVTVDQVAKNQGTQKVGGEPEVRRRLAAFVEEMVNLQQVAQGEPSRVQLQQGDIQLHFRAKGKEEERFFGYVALIKEEDPALTAALNRISGLDKLSFSGYGIVSFAQLLELKASFDPQAQLVIAAEEKKRQTTA